MAGVCAGIACFILFSAFSYETRWQAECGLSIEKHLVVSQHRMRQAIYNSDETYEAQMSALAVPEICQVIHTSSPTEKIFRNNFTLLATNADVHHWLASMASLMQEPYIKGSILDSHSEFQEIIRVEGAVFHKYTFKAEMDGRSVESRIMYTPIDYLGRAYIIEFGISQRFIPLKGM